MDEPLPPSAVAHMDHRDPVPQAVVEVGAECGAPQAVRERHVHQALVEPAAECEALHAAPGRHALQTQVETVAECEALQAARQSPSTISERK